MSEAIIEMCDNGHKFAKLPDHPRKHGQSRCPHCLSVGYELFSEQLTEARDETKRLAAEIKQWRKIVESLRHLGRII